MKPKNLSVLRCVLTGLLVAMRTAFRCDGDKL